MSAEYNKTELTSEEKWGVVCINGWENCCEVNPDMVEVVRCKDCVWYDERRSYAGGHTLYECRNLERFFPSNFFCKDGEKREDEHQSKIDK